MIAAKVLLIGASGQLGQALWKSVPAKIELFALTRRECDLCDKSRLELIIKTLNPDLIVNCAAYTNVDMAESEAESAFRLNAQALSHLAEIARCQGARLVTFSTDYVFDGNSKKAYTPESEPSPINVYGASKLEGERLAADILGDSLLIIRTAWLYSPWGTNFVKTILRLLNESNEIKVVNDQYGSPTWATSLAHTTWQLIKHNSSGIYHFADGGVASWYEFACAIRDEALEHKLVVDPAEIISVSSLEAGRPARRPAWSVLDSNKAIAVSSLEPLAWQVCLGRFFADEFKRYACI